MQNAVGREPFDRHDLGSVRLHGEHRARLDGLPVYEHGAGAADARLAADMRAGQVAALAQIVHEQDTRLDVMLMVSGVDANANWNGQETSRVDVGGRSFLETMAP